MHGSEQYNFFRRANARYEQHLSATREPGEFPYPQGNHRGYTGKAIKDIPQDVVWWALRASNRHQDWVCRFFPYLLHNLTPTCSLFSTNQCIRLINVSWTTSTSHVLLDPSRFGSVCGTEAYV